MGRYASPAGERSQDGCDFRGHGVAEEPVAEVREVPEVGEGGGPLAVEEARAVEEVDPSLARELGEAVAHLLVAAAERVGRAERDRRGSEESVLDRGPRRALGERRLQDDEGD